jgi:hypothetical protein
MEIGFRPPAYFFVTANKYDSRHRNCLQSPQVYTGSVMSNNQKGPSWTLMLALIALAILLASAIAYKLIAPFFHH